MKGIHFHKIGIEEIKENNNHEIEGNNFLLMIALYISLLNKFYSFGFNIVSVLSENVGDLTFVFTSIALLTLILEHLRFSLFF